ncbi:hypothetical protein DZB54_01035 [Herbaspirillum sp. 3R-3a1]|nr:hypothetical protein DZB54_01035 [Herbaspirillum sp. 3R-3a1]
MKIGVVVISFAPLIAAAGNFFDDSYEPKQPFDDYAKQEENFIAIDEKARLKKVALMDYAQAGITLSDSSCKLWISSLGRADRDSGFFKNILNIAGNLILGIAGINGANPSSLAKGSLGLSAGNASIDTFKNDIIIGAIEEVGKKMSEGRELTAKNFTSQLPANYDEIKRWLINYHQGCSRQTIKDILKSGLDAVKYVLPDTSLASPIDQAKGDILTTTLYADMYGAGSIGKFSDDSLYKLYVIEIFAPGASLTSDSINSIKNDPFIKILATNFESKNKDARIATLDSIAEYRGYKSRLKAALDKEVTDKKAAETATAQQAVDQAAAKVEADKKKLVDSSSAKPAEEQKFVETLVGKIATLSLRSNVALPAVNSLTAEVAENSKIPSSTEKKSLEDSLTNLQNKLQTLEAAKNAEQRVTSGTTPRYLPTTAVLVPLNR